MSLQEKRWEKIKHCKSTKQKSELNFSKFWLSFRGGKAQSSLTSPPFLKKIKLLIAHCS